MKKIIQVVMFLCLAGYIHATMVSGRSGYILIINADGSVNAVSVGVSTSIVTGSSVTLHATVYQNADWKVNFDSTTGKVAIYFTGSLPAGTQNIGDVDIASISSTTAGVTFYPDSSITTDFSSGTAGVAIYPTDTLPVSDAGGSFTIDSASGTTDVTIYPAATLPTNDAGGSFTTDTTPGTSGVAFYPAVTVPVSVSDATMSSTTAEVTMYPAATLPVSQSSGTSGVAFYPAGTIPVSFSSSSEVAVYPVGKFDTSGSSVTTKDERYEGKTSSHTAGRLTADGNIPITADNVYAWSFEIKGGDATVTGIGGTIYCFDDEGINHRNSPVALVSPTFTVDLDTGDTFYYIIYGFND